MKAQLNLAPDYEVIVCPPQESFRWYTHDYPFHLARWNYHPEYELHLIRSTSGTMMIGDHLGDFGPGNLILTGPNLPHNWVSNIPPGEVVHNRDMLVQFTPQFADRISSLCLEMGGIRGLFDEAVYGIEFTGSTADTGRRLLEQVGAAHGAERVLLFLRLIDALSREPRDRRRLSRLAPARQAELPRAIDQAMRFLNEAHAEDIDLFAVAKRVGMSAQSFSRLFKRQTGHTFASYLVLTRVYAACAVLSQTHRPITDICFDVGFNNVANFNRQFLKVCGCTPSEYRRIAHRVGANSGTSSPNAPSLAAINGGKV